MRSIFFNWLILALLFANGSLAANCKFLGEHPSRVITQDKQLQELCSSYGKAYKQAKAKTQDAALFEANNAAWIQSTQNCPDAGCVNQAFNAILADFKQGKTTFANQDKNVVAESNDSSSIGLSWWSIVGFILALLVPFGLMSFIKSSWNYNCFHWSNVIIAVGLTFLMRKFFGPDAMMLSPLVAGLILVLKDWGKAPWYVLLAGIPLTYCGAACGAILVWLALCLLLFAFIIALFGAGFRPAPARRVLIIFLD